jgi:hypothetical protein
MLALISSPGGTNTPWKGGLNGVIWLKVELVVMSQIFEVGTWHTCGPFLGKLRQEDCLNPGVPDQPGQHTDRSSQKRKKKDVRFLSDIFSYLEF